MIIPTPAQAAAATRLRIAFQVMRAATRPIDSRLAHAALDGATEILAAMEGITGASAYYEATRDAVDEAPTRPVVAFTSPGGGNAATAWDADVDARLAVDIALLAAGLAPAKVRAHAAQLADVDADALDGMTWEAEAELAQDSYVRRSYGAKLAAAVALARTARVPA